MSNAGQAAGGFVGAVIGFVVTGGSPAGALYGAQIGLAASTYIFPTQLPHVYGPRIEDLSATKVELGVPIPYIYGTIAVPGFLMYLGCPEEVAHTEEIGGKGAPPEQQQTTYTYFQTLGLGLCEGPIDGILRIWENGELKYDIRPQMEGESDEAYADRVDSSSEYQSTAGTGFTLYLGDEEQLPDPTLETELGAGNVPAYRGTAYLVFARRQLKDEQARRHPQFKVEVYKSGTVGRLYLKPTNIESDITSWQDDDLAVDWARNRHYQLDQTSNPNASADAVLRVYNILDNTELEQIPLADFLPVPPYLFQYMMTGLDGFLYFNFFTGGDTVMLARVDPSTWETVAQASYGGGPGDAFKASWERAVFLRQYGAMGNTDYILTGTPVSDDLVLYRADTLLQGPAVISGLEDMMVCQGPVSGTTTYGFGLAWQQAGSGVGESIHIHRAVLSEVLVPPELVMVPTASIEEDYHVIAPSDIDPTWTRFTTLAGVVFDERDQCLIFAVRGGPASGSTNGSDTLVKWNPTTKAIVWQTEPGVLERVVFDSSHTNNTRLRGDRYVLTGPGPGEFTIVDTRTGAVSYVDFGDLMGSDTLEGEVAYDSVLDAMITHEHSSGPVVIFFNRREPGRVSRAEIVRDAWARCGGDEDDIDVTDLEDTYVLGYSTGIATGRGAIEPIRAPGGPFDVVESEGKLKFLTRGKPIVVTFAEEELGVVADDASSGASRPAAVICNRAQDVELPVRVRVKYIAPSRDYEVGMQGSPTRFTSATVGEKDVDLPVALDDTMALQTAEIMWAEAWNSKNVYETAVDIAHLGLDPADPVGLPFKGRVRRSRIVVIDDSAGGLLRKLQLVRDDDGINVSSRIAAPPARRRTRVAIYAESGLIMLDLPPLRDQDDSAGFYAAAYPTTAGAWSGAVIHRSNDGGATFTPTGAVTGTPTVGRLAADLGVGVTETWDDINEVVVDLICGEFESREENALLSYGANALAIGAHGRWEIVQFQNAEQLTATRWRLSHLLRGRRATEHNVGSGIVTDFVVLLNGAITRLALQNSDIGTEKTYRVVTIGMSFSAGTNQAFTGTGESLETFSPVHIEGERDGSNNLTVTWTRRGRIGHEMPDGADVPLSEETESYQIDIVTEDSPETVLRTLTSSVTNVVYTAAQQTTDGLTPGEPVRVKVYQMSAVVGRGHPGEATV